MRKAAVNWSTIFGLVVAVLLPINVQAASAGTGAEVISAGEEHTCLVVSGGVKCVGANYSGQLGNGTFEDSFTAVEAIPAGSGATQVVAGGEHTCAIVLGGVECWGANYEGQLGTGNLAGSLNPVVIIPAGSGATAIAANYSHTCAVVSGGLQCWGYNGQGQLGNGTTDNSTLPISVFPAGSGVTSVGVGSNHTCAVVAGGIKCWGYNYYGQLGNGTQENEFAEPLDIIPAGSNATFVSANSNHTCAVIAGGVQCWGNNGSGELGNGTDSSSSLPVTAIPAGSGATSVSNGGSHTCALVSGTVQCWGHNWAGQLGIGTFSEREMSPQVVIDSQTGAKSVSAGGSHTCAILNSGFVKCWGFNYSGELGVGYGGYRTTPVSTIPEGSGVTAIDAGDNHVCVLIDGGVKCWGGNDSGQLGNGTTVPSADPVIAIPSGSGVTSISSGYRFTCAIVMGGVQCWGNNNTGQLGNGTSGNSANPVWAIPQGSGATSVSTWSSHACAALDGGVFCWGDNNFGQLGTGDRLPSFTPVTAIEAGSSFSYVAAGAMHTCAATSNTVLVKCWGANMFGQIGDSGGDGSNSPVLVALPPGMAAPRVATGYGHTCATVNAGVYCWGANYNGQIGDGTDAPTINTPAPAIEAGSGATDVSLGERHSCALISGGVKCWGDNSDGQLGNGTKQSKSSAVSVSLLGANVTGISAGGSFTCAVVAGGVKCWGDGEDGQLGYLSNSNLPKDATGFGLAETQKFQVTYVASGIKGQLPTQADVEDGATFQLAAAPVKTGYRFAGWSDGSQVYAAGATYPSAGSVTGDVQLTATWAAIKPSTNKKLTYSLVGFAAGTSKLTKSMMLTLNAVAKSASSGAQVTCSGYTGGPSVLAIDKYIALNRATVVCNYLAKKNPKLANFKVKTVNTKIVSANQRKTVVTLSK